MDSVTAMIVIRADQDKVVLADLNKVEADRMIIADRSMIVAAAAVEDMLRARQIIGEDHSKMEAHHVLVVR